MRAIKENEEMAISMAMVDEASEAVKDNEGLAYHAKKQFVNNVYHLPIGHHLVQQLLPPARGDWIELNRHTENIICAAYGVPRSNLINDSHINENSTKISNTTFSETINAYGRFIGRVLTRSYDDVYGREDGIESIREVGDSIEDMTAEEIRALPEKSKITVKFISLPDVSRENLLVDYCTGVLTYPEFSQMTRTVAGYPRTEMDEKEDPWNDLLKSSVINANEGPSLKKLGLVANMIFPRITAEAPNLLSPSSSSSSAAPKRKSEGVDETRKKKKSS